MRRDASFRPIAIVADRLPERSGRLRHSIETSGFRVVEVSTLAEALAEVRESVQTVLAFVDVDLRDPDGASVADTLCARHPRLAVYAVAENSQEVEALQAVEEGARGFVLDRYLDSPLVSRIASTVMAERRLLGSLDIAESAILQSEYRYRTLFALAHDPMFMVDLDGVVIEANEPAVELLGLEGRGLLGRSLAEMVVTDVDRRRLELVIEEGLGEAEVAVQVERTGDAEADKLSRLVARPRQDAFGAFHGFFCSIETPREHVGESKFALLFVELAGIEGVDDSHGPTLGEDIFAAMAGRLGDAVREGDIVARMGDQEFAILLGEIPDRKIASLVTERIRAELAKPLRVGNRRVRLDCSIGGRSVEAVPTPTPDDDSGRDDSGVVLLEFPRRRIGGTMPDKGSDEGVTPQRASGE